jgi:hypothetical protein
MVILCALQNKTLKTVNNTIILIFLMLLKNINCYILW